MTTEKNEAAERTYEGRVMFLLVTTFVLAVSLSVLVKHHEARAAAIVGLVIGAVLGWVAAWLYFTKHPCTNIAAEALAASAAFKM
jgi:xanthine/uracil permease